MELRQLVEEAAHAWPQLERDPATASDSDLYISGADMIEWFSGWRAKAVQALAQQPAATVSQRVVEMLDRIHAAMDGMPYYGEGTGLPDFNEIGCLIAEARDGYHPDDDENPFHPESPEGRAWDAGDRSSIGGAK